MASPRIALLVSRDFGELSFALTFARCGQLPDAVLLLPDNLAQPESSLDGVSSRTYRGLPDILAVIDDLRPDAVLLCSGYLFCIGGLLDEASVTALLAALRARGITVLTSDPFLGQQYLTAPGAFDIAIPNGPAMAQHLRHLATLLRDCTHVYMAPASHLPTPIKAGCAVPEVLRRSTSTEARAERLRAMPRPLSEDRFWLYVLSNEDYHLQARARGEATFIHLLAQRMTDAWTADRLPVLVAPPGCVRLVAERLPPAQAALLLSGCPHRSFEDLLLGAEHAFYWNHLSHSIIARFYNELPTWFFAPGHLVQAIPGLYGIAHATYYEDYTVEDLDMVEAISPQRLSDSAQATRLARRALSARYARLTAPAEIVRLAMESATKAQA